MEELSATVNEIRENAQRTAQATQEAGHFVEQASEHLGISMEYAKNLIENFIAAIAEDSHVVEIVTNFLARTSECAEA